MSEPRVIELENEVQNLKNSNNILNSQVSSHAEVVSSLMGENLNLRCNFKLSQQYYQDSLKNAQSLQANIDNLNKELESLKTELDTLKNPPAVSEDSAQAA